MLVLALAGLFIVGSSFRIAMLAFQMSMAEDKGSYKLKIRYVLIALIISIIVGAGAGFNNIITSYFT